MDPRAVEDERLTTRTRSVPVDIAADLVLYELFNCHSGCPSVDLPHFSTQSLLITFSNEAAFTRIVNKLNNLQKSAHYLRVKMDQHKSTTQTRFFRRHSRASTTSNTSGASYSHPLYRASGYDTSVENFPEYVDTDLVSRFSSCSTSANSSQESLNSVLYQTEKSTNPSSVCSRNSSATKHSELQTFTHITHHYADDHYPLITSCDILDSSSTALSTLHAMAHAYNTFVRAINSAYNHAMSTSHSQLADYLLYNQTLFNLLSQHTRAQQQYIRPLTGPITPPSLFRHSRSDEEQDAINAAALEAWAEYIHDPSTASSYSGSYMRLLLSSFAPGFVQNLHCQVSVMASKVLSKEVNTAQIQKTWEKYQEVFIQNLDLYTDVALLLGCHDRHFTIEGETIKEEWPQLRTGQNTMVKKWYSRRHRGAWEFCPSDFSGQRRIIVSA